MAHIRVAAVDDQPIVLAGIAAAVRRHAPDIELVAIVTTVDELLAGSGAEADVVVLDLSMPRPSGQSIETDVGRLTAWGAHVVVFTGEERPVPVRRAVEAGANGLIMKVDPIDVVVDTIRNVAAGEFACSTAMAHALVSDGISATRLTERQLEILRLLARGATNRMVARALGVEVVTVREHLRRAAKAYREAGIEPGNTQGLINSARSEGHLDF